MRLAVLVSGSGTILEAMVDYGLQVELVVADRVCRGLEVADSESIAVSLVERDAFDETFDRERYADAVVDVLGAHEIDLVAMAGFGTVLGERAFEKFGGTIVNTHPALLPSFPGWHAVRDALEFGVKITGCTIHVATPQVDHGPILAQEAVAVLDGDDESSLHERIKVVERRLYVETLKDIMTRGWVLGP